MKNCLLIETIYNQDECDYSTIGYQIITLWIIKNSCTCLGSSFRPDCLSQGTNQNLLLGDGVFRRGYSFLEICIPSLICIPIDFALIFNNNPLPPGI